MIWVREQLSRYALILILLLATAQGPAHAQIFRAVSDSEEVRVGQAAAREVEKQYPILRRGSAPQYLEQLGQKLVRASDRRNIRYHFRLIDQDEVNAFALPGGYIYVFRGLMSLTENESELAGVLAHEIAHVSERHHVDQMKKAQTIGLGLGILDMIFGRQRSVGEDLGALGAQLFAQGVFSKFSRDAEREADREGVQILRRARINPNGMITLFEKLEGLREKRPSAVQEFFATHPNPAERRQNVRQMLSASDGQLSRDSRSFQEARRALR
ncbi:MAG TPA: M48 family metallopeptidase [Acidobacteriota bacterium]|nr:M48 family metallopeptidase [Acidobacteriota bacterium]